MTCSPFKNCRFRECDLPRQCKSDGQCHHPATAQSAGNPNVAAALPTLAPAALDARAEHAAKALERERCKQFEWTDEEFEIWWNEDDRCKRADRIAEARFILLTAPAESPAPLTNERILEIRNQAAGLVAAECAGSDALWIRAVRTAIAEAYAGMAVTADASFDQWYAGQSHQLVNEQVCRLIWTRAWERCLAALRAGGSEIDAQRLQAEIAQSLVMPRSAARTGDTLNDLPRPVPDLFACLQRFAIVCADGMADSHTESREDILALAELGAVRTSPFGRTYMTDYGRWLLSTTLPDHGISQLPTAASWRDLLEAVLREIEDGEYLGPWTGTENAPGHGHDVPGIWDSHNGAKSGTRCGWCMTWNKARSALVAGHSHLIVPALEVPENLKRLLDLPASDAVHPVAQAAHEHDGE